MITNIKAAGITALIIFAVAAIIWWAREYPLVAAAAVSAAAVAVFAFAIFTVVKHAIEKK